MNVSKPATPKKFRAAKAEESNDPNAVDAFLAQSNFPLRADVATIRAIILGADRRITEGIKWNSPSFYRNGWFATCNLRRPDAILIVFHLGAKVRDNRTGGLAIKDPTGLLHWVAKERAVVTLKAGEVTARKLALTSIVQQWIEHQPAE